MKTFITVASGFVLLTLLTSCATTPGPADETAVVASHFRLERDAIWKERRQFRMHVRDLFNKQDFASLEKLGDTLSHDFSVAGDGTYSFKDFMDAFDSLDLVQSGSWDRTQRQMHVWMDQYPQSAASRLCFIRLVEVYATAARSPQWPEHLTLSEQSAASEVTYQERMKLSHPVNGQLTEEKPHNPFYFTGMMVIALAEQWPESYVFNLFEEEKEAYPSIWTADLAVAHCHTSGTASFYVWPHRALKEISRPGGLGTETYARVINDMKWSYKDNMYDEIDVDWDQANAGLHILVTKYPASRYLWSELAVNAVMAKDPATAREAFAHLNGVGDPEVFRTAAYADYCLNYAQAHPIATEEATHGPPHL